MRSTNRHLLTYLLTYYKLFLDIWQHFSENCRQTGVVAESNEFGVFPMLHLREFQKYRSTLLYIMTITRSEFLPTPITMTLNELERPVHLKVHLADCTLELTYVCYGFQSWPYVTGWTRALNVSDINVANELYSFWAKEVCRNFRGGLLHTVLVTSGDRPSYWAMVERRDGPSDDDYQDSRRRTGVDRAAKIGHISLNAASFRS